MWSHILTESLRPARCLQCSVWSGFKWWRDGVCSSLCSRWEEWDCGRSRSQRSSEGKHPPLRGQSRALLAEGEVAVVMFSPLTEEREATRGFMSCGESLCRRARGRSRTGVLESLGSNPKILWLSLPGQECRKGNSMVWGSAKLEHPTVPCQCLRQAGLGAAEPARAWGPWGQGPQGLQQCGQAAATVPTSGQAGQTWPWRPESQNPKGRQCQGGCWGPPDRDTRPCGSSETPVPGLGTSRSCEHPGGAALESGNSCGCCRKGLGRSSSSMCITKHLAQLRGKSHTSLL